ncbi:MAG: hypothetical protein WBY94_26580 [Polyangiaceae bacterium]
MLGQASTDVTGHQWVPLMALLSTWIVQLLSRDSRFPITLPASWEDNRWKPVAIVIVSQVQAVAVAHMGGQSWHDAVILGLHTAMWSMGLWSLTVKAVWNDKAPAWVKWLAMSVPTPPSASLPGRNPPDPPKAN